MDVFMSKHSFNISKDKGPEKGPTCSNIKNLLQLLGQVKNVHPYLRVQSLSG